MPKHVYMSIISKTGTKALLFSPEDIAFIDNMDDEAFDRLALLVEKAIETLGYEITDVDTNEPSITISAAEMVMARVISRLRLQSVYEGYSSKTERVGEASVTKTVSSQSSSTILNRDDIDFITSIAGKVKKRFSHFDAY